MYNDNQHSLSLDQFHIPMAVHDTRELSILSNQSTGYFVYHDNVIYSVGLEHKSLSISSLDTDRRTWTRNISGSMFSNLSIDQTATVRYVGVHKTSSGRIKLNIFLNGHNVQILSWLIGTDLYSVHEYPPNQVPVVINDYGTNLVLSSPINNSDEEF